MGVLWYNIILNWQGKVGMTKWTMNVPKIPKVTVPMCFSPDTDRCVTCNGGPQSVGPASQCGPGTGVWWHNNFPRCPGESEESEESEQWAGPHSSRYGSPGAAGPGNTSCCDGCRKWGAARRFQRCYHLFLFRIKMEKIKIFWRNDKKLNELGYRFVLRRWGHQGGIDDYEL